MTIGEARRLAGIGRRAALDRAVRGGGAGRETGAPIVSGFIASASSRKRIGPIASSSPAIEPGFFDQPAIDANAVAAAQVANQDPVVSHRQATMPARDFWRIDPDVALEMPADQEDRTLQDDERRGSRDQWD